MSQRAAAAAADAARIRGTLAAMESRAEFRSNLPYYALAALGATTAGVGYVTGFERTRKAVGEQMALAEAEAGGTMTPGNAWVLRAMGVLLGSTVGANVGQAYAVRRGAIAGAGTFALFGLFAAEPSAIYAPYAGSVLLNGGSAAWNDLGAAACRAFRGPSKAEEEPEKAKRERRGWRFWRKKPVDGDGGGK